MEESCPPSYIIAFYLRVVYWSAPFAERPAPRFAILSRAWLTAHEISVRPLQRANACSRFSSDICISHECTISPPSSGLGHTDAALTTSSLSLQPWSSLAAVKKRRGRDDDIDQIANLPCDLHSQVTTECGDLALGRL